MRPHDLSHSSRKIILIAGLVLGLLSPQSFGSTTGSVPFGFFKAVVTYFYAIGANGIASNAYVSGQTFSSGAGNGMFDYPSNLAYDSSNNLIYIVDSNNNRIVKVTASTGAFVGAIGNIYSSAGTCPASGAASSWCTGGAFIPGSADGMFNAPSGIAYDSTNDALYIADPGNNRVLKVTASTGTFVGAIGKTSSSSGTCPASGAASAWCTGGVFVAGTGNGMFSSPVAMAYDSANNALYIADASNNLIVKVTATTGAFVGAIGETVSSTGTCPAAGAASSWCTGGVFTAGTGNGMFDSPSGLAFNSTGNALYIGDTNNNRIVKVTATTGAFVGAIGETVSSTGTCPASGVASSWCTGGVFTAGTGNGMFSNPFSMAYDSTNNALYIADQYNGRIVKKTPP